MWWLMASAIGWAGIPDSVHPVAAPIDAPAQYAEWIAASGASPSLLACDVVWESEALLCFKVVERKRRRWVTEADLVKWKTDLAGLRAWVSERAAAKLADQPTRTAVEDMEAWYWVAAEGDGWAAAGLLRPELLAEKVGGAPILVAMPVEGALLAWKPGDPELDKVMAVAARRMVDDTDGAVTAVVHQWSGTRWVAFGAAVPTEP